MFFLHLFFCYLYCQKLKGLYDKNHAMTALLLNPVCTPYPSYFWHPSSIQLLLGNNLPSDAVAAHSPGSKMTSLAMPSVSIHPLQTGVSSCLVLSIPALPLHLPFVISCIHCHGVHHYLHAVVF